MAKTTTALEFHALKKESPTATTTIKGLNRNALIFFASVY